MKYSSTVPVDDSPLALFVRLVPVVVVPAGTAVDVAVAGIGAVAEAMGSFLLNYAGAGKLS